MSGRDRPWVMRTYSGHSSARASNELYRTNLAKGQTGLSIAFDLPTQTGYDPDHELARGEVGKVGVPVPHLGETARLVEVAEIHAPAPRVVPRRTVCEIVEARVEELLDLVRVQLERWGPPAQLPAGVVLTGGSALLPGLVEAASERWGLPVRVGHPRGMLGPAAAVSGPAYATAVSRVRA